MDAIIGRKLGMTRLFEEDGRVIPVTVIEAGPCPVLQVRQQAEGQQRWMVQLGFGARKPKRATKAEAGHAKRAGVDTTPAVVREFAVPSASVAPTPSAAPTAAGQMITVAIFEPGQRIKVIGTTKGRGFQGVVKRHGFRGRPASHGHPKKRNPGTLGPGTNPSRVIKGKKMPGQYGDEQQTAMNLRVEKVDAERNLLYIRGGVPGARNSVLYIKKA